MKRARGEPGPSARAIHLTVAKTARVMLLGEPAATTRQLWIACHGYGQLAAEFAAGLRVLATADRLVAVPEALNRYYLDDHGGVHGPTHPVGATWMTREERDVEIADYCAYLDVVHDHVSAFLPDAPGTAICALGFSQGAATAARWAARTTRRIDHVVLWGAGLPPELEPQPAPFGNASLTLVAGARDTHGTEQVERHEREPRPGGRVCTVERFQGGHRLDDETLRRIADRVGRVPPIA